MIHECKVQCHSMDIMTAQSLGIEDAGKWLPFIFHMDMVDAAKMSSDDEDSPTYGCTSIFCKSGETYIIDTPYMEFFQKFIEWNSITFEDGKSDDDDLNL